MSRPHAVRGYTVICLVVVLASWLVATTHAVTRPLFQVSDEINYLNTVQLKALEDSTPASRSCIAPPDGATLNYPPGGGKFGFHHVAAWLLRGACGAGAGTASIIVVRLLLALSLPALVVVTWALARVVAPDDPFVHVGAAVVTALHPVIATFAAGVTPDSLANPCAGVALLAAAHLLLRQGGLAWLAVLFASSLAAIASKDSALFLLPVSLVVAAWWSAAHWTRAWMVVVIVGPLGAVIMATGALMQLATPFPNFMTVLRDGLRHPVPFLGRLVEPLVVNAEGLVRSGLGGLANFGGGDLQVPDTLLVLQLAVLAGGLVAYVLACWSTSSGDRERLRFFLWLTTGASFLVLIQIPIRQMMTDSIGPMQGRWLFPVWPLIAVAVMTGWQRWLGRHAWRTLPLVVLLATATSAISLLQVVGHYYERWPVAYRWEHVFLYAAEGYDAGTAHATAMAGIAVVPGTLRNAAMGSAGLALGALTLLSLLSARRLRGARSCPTS